MKILSNVKKMVYAFFDFFYDNQLRKRLKTKEFSIICSNCMGGVIYHRLGVEFQTPTINQFMSDKDFFKFVTHLDYYFSVELMDAGYENGYPMGRLGDIKIQFTHYSSSQEAIAAWNRRKKRINFDKLYLILFDTVDGAITKDDIIAFGKIPCANRVVLSKNRYPDVDYVITIPINKKDANVHYMDRNIIGRRRFDGKFDYVSWINCENRN